MPVVCGALRVGAGHGKKSTAFDAMADSSGRLYGAVA
jgi:hypothetical protein